ncbi:LexA family protein [Achromobacter denitrificans]|uniref:LexA family protein n=1 Tax=Achromobacter sp. 2789STDY5608633 TaxID=1806501 RepID=UPI0006C83B29|nr:translesion error-prone DNA polymerase V autoproteolytic subunit [Achromobacter sp. 2789STDY5608633]
MNVPVRALPGSIPVHAISGTVQCGFPSPAEDHAEQRLDLNELLVRQPDATFFMRVRGPSMSEAGIDDGDYAVVDRSITPAHGQIVVAVVDGEYTIKRLYRRGRRVRLDAANPTFPNIELRDGQELVVWGVVTWTIKCHLPGAA